MHPLSALVAIFGTFSLFICRGPVQHFSYGIIKSKVNETWILYPSLNYTKTRGIWNTVTWGQGACCRLALFCTEMAHILTAYKLISCYQLFTVFSCPCNSQLLPLRVDLSSLRLLQMWYQSLMLDQSSWLASSGLFLSSRWQTAAVFSGKNKHKYTSKFLVPDVSHPVDWHALSHPSTLIPSNLILRYYWHEKAADLSTYKNSS